MTKSKNARSSATAKPCPNFSAIALTHKGEIKISGDDAFAVRDARSAVETFFEYEKNDNHPILIHSSWTAMPLTNTRGDTEIVVAGPSELRVERAALLISTAFGDLSVEGEYDDDADEVEVEVESHEDKLIRLRGGLGKRIAQTRVSKAEPTALADLLRLQQVIDDELLIVEQQKRGLKPTKRNVDDVPSRFHSTSDRFMSELIYALSVSAADDALRAIEREYWCETIEAEEAADRLFDLPIVAEDDQLTDLKKMYRHGQIDAMHAVEEAVDRLHDEIEIESPEGRAERLLAQKAARKPVATLKIFADSDVMIEAEGYQSND